ncbi:ABC transporter permease [Populibacterium corticicola]|uniref:ABC transporter permease n=1 Tax=Populibacterium corticicola TaxID=1812826 RepID=A0ABW5XCK8_9MICO
MQARGWIRPIARFAGGAALVLWGAVTLAFAVLKLIPGDPVSVMLGPLSSATPEARAAIRASLGLDRPVIEQYFSYIGRVVTGDLGQSYQQGRQVSDILVQAATPTLLLSVSALGLAALLAVAGSFISRRGALRRVVDFVELLAVSAPVFWTALILAAVFSYGLGWFPVIGGSQASRLVLPAIAMALPIAGTLGQVLRQGLDTAEAEPFSLTARARGLSRLGVTAKHSLRHAGTGTLTLTGYLFGSLLGGAVLIETVFARPGLGRVTLDAILGRDIPVVMGAVLLSGVIFIVINLIVDLLALVLDPRLRPSRGGTL